MFSPVAGLGITNYTRGFETVKRGWSFESEAKGGEIFVFCLSKRDTQRIRSAFKAAACVEIANPHELYRRVERAVAGVSLPGKPGRERIGHPVTYYDSKKPPEVRWALPDLIALSKFESFDWQHEQRLVYSRTDALAFQNTKMRLINGSLQRTIDPFDHKHEDVDIGDISDIASLRKF